MLYLYDNAIVEDLQKAIDPQGNMNQNIKAMNPGELIGLLAEIEEDKVSFPLVCVIRDEDITLDSNRANFARLHSGHVECFDPKTNNLYFEKSVPIELKYAIHILATNSADLDELTREIFFRYSSKYFITMKKPYEGKINDIRFGVSIPPGVTIRRESANSEYIKEGKLYESIIPITCDGAVWLSYTPRHMTRVVHDIELK